MGGCGVELRGVSSARPMGLSLCPVCRVPMISIIQDVAIMYRNYVTLFALDCKNLLRTITVRTMAAIAATRKAGEQLRAMSRPGMFKCRSMV